MSYKKDAGEWVEKTLKTISDSGQRGVHLEAMARFLHMWGYEYTNRLVSDAMETVSAQQKADLEIFYKKED